ncbi:HDIG domain-containing protein [Sulfobacillus thermosulfidooxidans DSM 9293]|uniref:HDIG domain-containing protein n=1 Tax=Sulfobacillus thermosulfidooxidans (strain DSM 9293 / VKM B-1269 / AT-1) TaxID=929705 RepID=A0A1W1WGN7_SULTA|nr:HDIG domain-containing protein [Sulfobacillus thermosulfidooxidans DSM 9293]
MGAPNSGHGCLFVKNLTFIFHLNPTDALFFLAIVVASLVDIRLLKGNGGISVQLPIIFSTSIILGPSAGLWLGGFGSIVGREYLGKVKWPSFVFNRAQFGIAGWASGEVFQLLSGSANHLAFTEISFPLTVAAITAFVLNWGFVMIAIALRTKRPIFETFRVYFKWSTPTFLLMIPIAYSMAIVYKELGPYGELIFAVPLAFVRYALALLRGVHTTYHRSIDILLTAINYRDAYTYGHSIRVGHYAAKLAEQFGMPQDRIDLVREAGLLHDVGKLKTPDSILRKAGRLNREEVLMMKDHPVIGSELLEQVQLAGCSRHFVRQHHERWDGRGYPDNLEGNEIALETRIISVVDAYDAMTTDRPYRRAMPHAMAMAEIQNGAGTQFDPEVVAKFVEMCGDRNLAVEEAIAQGWNHVGIEHRGDTGHGHSG